MDLLSELLTAVNVGGALAAGVPDDADGQESNVEQDCLRWSHCKDGDGAQEPESDKDWDRESVQLYDLHDVVDDRRLRHRGAGH